MLEDGVRQRADPVPNADGPCRRRAPGGLAPARHSVEQVAGAAARCRTAVEDEETRLLGRGYRRHERSRGGLQGRNAGLAAGERRRHATRPGGRRILTWELGCGSEGSQGRPTAAEETSHWEKRRRERPSGSGGAVAGGRGGPDHSKTENSKCGREGSHEKFKHTRHTPIIFK